MPARRPSARAGPGHDTPAGFTLVEVLVALFIMAGLAALAWRGLDGIVRARDGSNAAMDRALRLNTVVTQWEQDLLAVQDTGSVPALSFDGQSLRLTRRVDGGMALVVWAVRGGVWQRWTSPAATRAGELGDHWLRSQQLLGNEAAQISLGQATTWQVYFYRGNAWTNAQSTGDLAAPDGRADLLGPAAAAPPAPASAASSAGPGASGVAGGAPTPEAVALAAAAAAAAAAARQREQLPDAVRLVITLDAGTLTRDIALGPGGS